MHRDPIVKPKRKSSILIFLIFFAILTLILIQFFYHKQMKTEAKSFIPRSVIFDNPDIIGVKVSPNGKHMTYIAPHNGVLNIFFVENKDLKNAKPVTSDTHRGIREYFWSYDNEHIFYLQDNDGDENQHLFRLSIHSFDKPVDMTPIKGVKATIVQTSKQEDLVGHILIGMNDRRKDLFDIYLLNTKSGERSLIYQNDHYFSVDFDENFQMRFASKTNSDGSIEIYKFNKQEVGIRNLIHNETSESLLQNCEPIAFMTIKAEDVYTTDIIGFGKDYETIYMKDSRNQDKSDLIQLNLNNQERKVIYKSDKADVSDAMQNPITKAIEAVSFNYTKNQWVFFDNNVKSKFDLISKEIGHDAEIQIVSRSTDDKVWIAAALSDIKPPQYYKLENNQVEFLFSGDSKLQKYSLAQMHSVVIEARDGLEMVSYLTLPKEVTVLTTKQHDDNVLNEFAVTQSVPLILYVHGGPTARDEWGLNKVHQWLADRGYAVLSVNYRGSTGFGKAFINAGNGEWSRKMHDDLIDAAEWAISKGITAHDKIGIMGGSYGGYAALVGVTFTPDFFQCAVDIVGPSNLVTLLQSVPEYWQPMIEKLNRKTGGNTTTSEGIKELLDRSPITRVNSIIKPLLIGQGANDPRVKQSESDQIVKAMQEKNIPVIYALYSDEGHGFARPENRMSFFALTEYFLFQHLHGDFESIKNDFVNSSINIQVGQESLPQDVLPPVIATK